MQKLLTKELEKQLPSYYKAANSEDPIVHAHFFSPYSNWDWYVLGGMKVGDDYHFFCLVYGFEREYGPVSLNELQNVRKGQLQLVERDAYWNKCKVSELPAFNRTA